MRRMSEKTSTNKGSDGRNITISIKLFHSCIMTYQLIVLRIHFTVVSVCFSIYIILVHTCATLGSFNFLLSCCAPRVISSLSATSVTVIPTPLSLRSTLSLKRQKTTVPDQCPRVVGTAASTVNPKPWIIDFRQLVEPEMMLTAQIRSLAIYKTLCCIK